MILNGNVSPVTLSILCIIFLLVSGASASPAEIEKLLAEVLICITPVIRTRSSVI